MRLSLQERSALAIAVILLGTFAQGCGTLICGTHQRIEIQTNPPGAMVKIDGKVQGTTPIVLQLVRPSRINETARIDIEKAGCVPARLILRQRENPWFDLNDSTVGWVGSFLDKKTGAVYRYMPRAAMISLSCRAEMGLQSSIEERGGATSCITLRDGTVLRGTLLEIDPEGRHKVQLEDGSVLVIERGEVSQLKPLPPQ